MGSRLEKPDWVERLRRRIMAWRSRMASPACWPGLPCTVYANFNSLVVRLSGYTVKRDDSGNLSVTLTWSAPEDLPIAVIGEDFAFPPDIGSVATILIGAWSGSGASSNVSAGAWASPAGAGSKLISAWFTPTRVGVIVMASSPAAKRSD